MNKNKNKMIKKNRSLFNDNDETPIKNYNKG